MRPPDSTILSRKALIADDDACVRRSCRMVLEQQVAQRLQLCGAAFLRVEISPFIKLALDMFEQRVHIGLGGRAIAFILVRFGGIALPQATATLVGHQPDRKRDVQRGKIRVNRDGENRIGQHHVGVGQPRGLGSDL